MARTPAPPANPRKHRLRAQSALIAIALGLAGGGLALSLRRTPPASPSRPAQAAAQEESRLRAQIQATPASPEARLRYVEFLLAQRRNAEALDAAQEALRLAPKDPLVRSAAADTFAATGRITEAIDTLHGAGTTESGTRLQLASFLLQDGNRDQAVHLLTQLVAPTPGQALTAAQLLIDARDPVAAAALLKPVLAQHPGGEVRNHYGFVLLLAGRYPEAADLLLAGARENPEVPALHYYAGSALRLSGKLERLAEAETELRQAVTLMPQDAFFQYELALCLAQQRNWEGARAAIEEASKLSPETPEIQRDLARADRKTKLDLPAALAQARYDRLVDDAPAAVRVLKPLADREPDNVELGLALSVALHAASRFPEASQLLQSLLTRHPGNAEILWSQYRLQSALKQYDQALATLQLLEKSQGDDPVILSERVDTLQHLARYAEAEPILFQLRDRTPGDAEVHYNLGSALSLWSARPDAKEVARTELQKAVELRPDYAPALYALGQLFQGQGKPAEAVTYLRRAVDLVPTHIDAQRLLGRAYAEAGDQARSASAFRMYRKLQQREDERQRLELPVRHMRDLRRSRMEFARYQLRTGNRKEAIRQLEAMTHQFPEEREAHELLLGLYGHARRFQAQFEERLWLQQHPGSPSQTEVTR